MSTEQDIINEVVETIKKDKLLPSQYAEQLQYDLSSKIITREDWALILELSVSKQEGN